MRLFRILRLEIFTSVLVFLLLFAMHPADAWPTTVKVCLTIGVFTCVALARALFQAKGIIDLLLAENGGDSVRSAEIARKFFVAETIASLRHKLDHVREAQEMDPHELDRYTKLCFNHCPGKYIGTDLHVPSEFNRIYPLYLVSQSERGTAPGDVRFLFVTRARLEADLVAHPKEVTDFVLAHLRDGIQLLIVDPQVATEMAAKVALESPEFGIFSWHFIVYFKSKGADAFSIIAQDIDSDPTIKQRLKVFFEGILPHSQSIFWRDKKLFFRPQTDSSVQILLDHFLSK